jgi:hypothetical protein
MFVSSSLLDYGQDTFSAVTTRYTVYSRAQLSPGCLLASGANEAIQEPTESLIIILHLFGHKGLYITPSSRLHYYLQTTLFTKVHTISRYHSPAVQFIVFTWDLCFYT